MNKIHFFFNKLKKHFVYKIFFSYCAIFLGFLTLVTFINSYRLSQREINQSIYTGTNVLNQTSAYIQYRVQEINGIINVITYSDTIQQALIDGENYYSHSVANWNIQTSHGIKKISYGSYTSNDVREIRLYSNSGQLSFEETDAFKSLDKRRQDEWHERLSSAPSNSIWIPSSFFPSPNHTKDILLVNRIAALTNMKKYLGYIISTIPESTFTDIVNQAETTQNTSVILYNSKNEVIVKSNSCIEAITPELINQIASENQLLNKDVLMKVSFLGRTYLMGVQDIAGNDWSVAMLIPYDDILKNSRTFQHQMITVILVILLISVPLIYLIGRSLTSRIVILKKQIASFSKGNLSDKQIYNGDDEIGDLTDSFYHMQTHIKSLMEEQYRQGFEIKDLELQVLQSQINPHFLYNTLEMIYWMGVKKNAPEISKVASELGLFYKLSLGNGEKVVTIEDEIKHIEAYVNIQNLRFNNIITLLNNIPVSLYEYQIVKLTLQPLIENAINHGIREKSNEQGTILLHGELWDNCIYLTIEDNGIGMTPEQLSSITVKRSHSSGHGYGVWNINERLKLTYGEKYGLSYSSEYSKGTKVTIKIPALLEDAEEDPVD